MKKGRAIPLDPRVVSCRRLPRVNLDLVHLLRLAAVARADAHQAGAAAPPEEDQAQVVGLIVAGGVAGAGDQVYGGCNRGGEQK